MKALLIITLRKLISSQNTPIREVITNDVKVQIHISFSAQFSHKHSKYLYIKCCSVFFFHSSEEWNKVSKSEREKLGVTVQDDGEFW